MLCFFRKLHRDDSGATAVEYGLIAGLMSVVAIAGFKVAGNHLSDTFEFVGNKLAAVTQNAP
jgi:pilus assembly protein Flp/PilA